jgi:hypothetical protein
LRHSAGGEPNQESQGKALPPVTLRCRFDVSICRGARDEDPPAARPIVHTNLGPTRFWRTTAAQEESTGRSHELEMLSSL